MFMEGTLIIQLPRAYEPYSFNADSEWREVFLWARILSGDCRLLPRKINTLISTGIEPGTSGMIDQCAVWLN